MDWTYTVRPGDSPWTIARRFCREKTCWPAIAASNGIAANALPRAGQRLRIPVRLLSRQTISATAAVVVGEAFVRRRNQPERRLATGDRLEIDDSVRTARGTVTVTFADPSELVVGPASEIRFDMLGAFGDGGMVDTQVRAVRGRLEPRVRPRPGGSSFRIVTPTGTAVVRGTEFRIRAEDASFAELTHGGLEFDGPAGSTTLAAGFGLVAPADHPPPAPESLLPAPAIAGAAGSPPRSIPFELGWGAVAGAQAYQVLLFRPGAEAVLVSVQRTPSNGITLAPEPGTYQVVVRAIAASGLEGLDGSATITAVAARPTVQLAADGAGARWDTVPTATGYELQQARDEAFSIGLRTFNFTEPRFDTGFPDGSSWLRVRALTPAGATDYSSPLRIDRPPPAILLEAESRSWNDAAWRLTWTAVPGARYRLQYAPDASFGDRTVEVLTELRSWSLECPFTSCSVRVRAELPAQGDYGAVAGPWSGTRSIGSAGFLRLLKPRG